MFIMRKTYQRGKGGKPNSTEDGVFNEFSPFHYEKIDFKF